MRTKVASFSLFYKSFQTKKIKALVTEQSYTLKAYTTQCILRSCLGKRVQIFHCKFHHMFEGEQDFERRRKKRKSGDGRHGYKMATDAMVIISDGRHGYKMATDA